MSDRLSCRSNASARTAWAETYAGRGLSFSAPQYLRNTHASNVTGEKDTGVTRPDRCSTLSAVDAAGVKLSREISSSFALQSISSRVFSASPCTRPSARVENEPAAGPRRAGRTEDGFQEETNRDREPEGPSDVQPTPTHRPTQRPVVRAGDRVSNEAQFIPGDT